LNNRSIFQIKVVRNFEDTIYIPGCQHNLAIVLGVLGVVSGIGLRNNGSHWFMRGKKFISPYQFLFFLEHFGTFFANPRRKKIDSFITLLVKVGEVFKGTGE